MNANPAPEKGSGFLRFGSLENTLLDSGDSALTWDDVYPEATDPDIVGHLRKYGGL